MARASSIPRFLRFPGPSLVLAMLLAACSGSTSPPTASPHGEGPAPAAPERKGSVEIDVASSSHPPFSREVTLPVDPLGLAWSGSELVITNRLDPWGLAAVAFDGDAPTRLAKVPVIEKRYRQKVGLRAIVWNGTQFVGYTDGSWFGRGNKEVFTIHDPATLQIDRVVPGAPPLLGALAWDGEGYWAATRRNTEDSGEPAFLYRLDAELKVRARHDPPAYGCQGLAWDGTNLWWVDVFEDAIYVLDVSGDEPRVVASGKVGLNYLSGIEVIDGRVWIAEYGDDRLLEIDPEQIAAHWPTGDRAPVDTPVGRASADDLDLESFKELMRSEDWVVRMKAEQQVREKGIPVPFDREVTTMPDERGPETVEAYWWEAELRDGTLYGSWSLYFGEGLFGDSNGGGMIRMPTFVRYTVTTEGGTLSAEVEKVFEAVPGDNEMTEVELATGLGRGEYSVDLFMHVQYVDPEGNNRILNESAMTLHVAR